MGTSTELKLLGLEALQAYKSSKREDKNETDAPQKLLIDPIVKDMEALKRYTQELQASNDQLRQDLAAANLILAERDDVKFNDTITLIKDQFGPCYPNIHSLLTLENESIDNPYMHIFSITKQCCEYKYNKEMQLTPQDHVWIPILEDNNSGKIVDDNDKFTMPARVNSNSDLSLNLSDSECEDDVEELVQLPDNCDDQQLDRLNDIFKTIFISINNLNLILSNNQPVEDKDIMINFVKMLYPISTPLYDWSISIGELLMPVINNITLLATHALTEKKNAQRQIELLTNSAISFQNSAQVIEDELTNELNECQQDLNNTHQGLVSLTARYTELERNYDIVQQELCYARGKLHSRNQSQRNSLEGLHSIPLPDNNLLIEMENNYKDRIMQQEATILALNEILRSNLTATDNLVKTPSIGQPQLNNIKWYDTTSILSLIDNSFEDVHATINGLKNRIDTLSNKLQLKNNRLNDYLRQVTTILVNCMPEGSTTGDFVTIPTMRYTHDLILQLIDRQRTLLKDNEGLLENNQELDVLLEEKESLLVKAEMRVSEATLELFTDKQRITDYQHKIDCLEFQLTEKECAIQEIDNGNTSKYEAIRNEIDVLIQEKSEITLLLNDLTLEKIGYMDEITSLNITNDQLNQQKLALQQECNQLNGNISILEVAHSQCKDNLITQLDIVSSQMDEIMTLKDELIVLQTDLRELLICKDAMNDKLNCLKRKLDDVELDRGIQVEEINKLKKIVSNQIGKVAILDENKYNSINKETESATCKVCSHERDVDYLVEINTAKLSLELYTNRCKEMEDKISSLTEEVNKLNVENINASANSNYQEILRIQEVEHAHELTLLQSIINEKGARISVLEERLEKLEVDTIRVLDGELFKQILDFLIETGVPTGLLDYECKNDLLEQELISAISGDVEIDHLELNTICTRLRQLVSVIDNHIQAKSFTEGRDSNFIQWENPSTIVMHDTQLSLVDWPEDGPAPAPQSGKDITTFVDRLVYDNKDLIAKAKQALDENCKALIAINAALPFDSDWSQNRPIVKQHMVL